ncbi:alcohol oxidase-like protein [Xylaria digitata]|nr:alcohol oxidase-like protein [Xylaria digitata]
MPLYSQLPIKLSVADVIIIGGGTAGCIVASRLPDADPEFSILVIERGGDNYGDPTIIHPALYIMHMAPNSPRMQFHLGRKSAALGGREPITPVAKVLGGGSSVNMLMYSRAQRSDFESWRAKGWSAEEMLRQMRKLETFHGQGSDDQHGFDGPIHVSAGTYTSSRLDDAFMNAIDTVGWKEIQDLGDLDTNNGAQRALRYISPKGLRQDTAHCYLHPRLRDGKHPNLHVLVESEVLKNSAELRTIKARKMVIVSSGALGTPTILERSSVGDPDVLKRAGVKLVASVPGVGSGYEDHQVCSSPYKSNLDVQETLDGFVNGQFDVPTMIGNNDKILGWNGLEITCKLRPNATGVATLGSDFQTRWDKDYKNNPNKPMIGVTLVAGNTGDPTRVPAGQYFTASTFNLYPYSRGYIHITGPGLRDTLDFDPGFFTDEHDIDIKKCRWAYKKQLEITRRMDMYRGELAVYHPPFPKSLEAACVELDSPLGADITDINYTAADDDIIDQWLRNNIGTTWHSLGTCKMLPQENGDVVDTNLGVYGVTGLKVADLSIVPHNVGAHTNNTAMVIGETASEIFIKELKLGS